MDTEIKKSISAAGMDAQYDEKAKRLLGNKIILAHILVKTVEEFRGMEPEDVAPYIEGEPFIGTVPVEPGQTNAETEKSGQRIVGMNTENAEIKEGLVRFDIIFYVRMKDGVSQMIVNVEAQKDTPAGYRLPNRAVFYVSRMVSSQKERDFVKMDYDSIKPVFSIWLCMDMEENCMDYMHLTNDRVLGHSQWEGGLGLLNIVLIGISKELPEHSGKYGLHRLLGAMLSTELSTEEKLGIMETEYNIPVNDKNFRAWRFYALQFRDSPIYRKADETERIRGNRRKKIFCRHKTGVLFLELQETAGGIQELFYRYCKG